MTTPILLALATGYLLGSIPFGLLLTRFSGRGDLRDIGSGNIGATNVLRTGSKGLAAATLLLDAAKGAAAVFLALHFWPEGIKMAAAGVLLGHLYPVWLKFSGGKGVATVLGVLIPLLPQAAMVYAIIWLSLLLLVRISSVAGMVAVASAPVSAKIFHQDYYFPLFLCIALLVIWKHKDNIRRLIAGTEPRIGRSNEEREA